MSSQAMITKEPTLMCNTVPAGWLTTDEVAELAGCSRITVTRAIRARIIAKVSRTSGGAWLINKDEGIHWAKNYTPYEEQRKRE